jgi:hypothetical protein
VLRHFGHWSFLSFSTLAESRGSKGVEVILSQFSILDDDGASTSSSMLACTEDKKVKSCPMIVQKTHQGYLEHLIQLHQVLQDRKSESIFRIPAILLHDQTQQLAM